MYSCNACIFHPQKQNLFITATTQIPELDPKQKQNVFNIAGAWIPKSDPTEQNWFITVDVLIPEVDQVQQNLFITAVYTEFLSRISRISHQLYLQGYIVHGYQDNGFSTKRSPLISALFVRFLFMEST